MVLADGTNTYLYGNPSTSSGQVQRIAQQQSTMQYFGADALGSVRQMYNSSGQIIANHRYDPFGNAISQSGVGTSNYGFTGEWTDATGLEFLRARYYAPGQGRFFTRDTFAGNPELPISLNFYNYAHDNPVNLTDPSGHCIIGVDCPITIAIAVFALIASLTSCANLPPTALPPTIPTVPPTVPKLGETSKPMFDDFMAYCRARDYACANEKWPYKLNPFEDKDPSYLALYESQIYSIYRGQGIDLDAIVQKRLNNPLDINAVRLVSPEAIIMASNNSRNLVYEFFIQDVRLNPLRVANYETYYLVKMIEQNKGAFYGAIDQCGEWCTGKLP